jgi:ethanolamine utilization protein EutN
MFTAVVKGSLTSTVKHPSMKGVRLMIVQPVDPVAGTSSGLPQIAADVLGAGIGTRVLVSSDGRAAQDMLKMDKSSPVRLVITALVDDAAKT